jgi:regulator of ribonuclease activity A
VTYATTDLCDAHPDVEVADPVFRDYGGEVAFHGAAVTLKVFEDNALVRELLEQPGSGQVLIVDGGGSLRCALLGGNLGQLGVRNGWAGIVVNGAIRDTEEIRGSKIGVKALGTCPRKSQKGLHSGHRDLAVRFAGVTFHSGFWVYADADGLIVSKTALHPRN